MNDLKSDINQSLGRPPITAGRILCYRITRALAILAASTLVIIIGFLLGAFIADHSWWFIACFCLTWLALCFGCWGLLWLIADYKKFLSLTIIFLSLTAARAQAPFTLMLTTSDPRFPGQALCSLAGADPDLIYQVQESTDLQTWSDLARVDYYNDVLLERATKPHHYFRAYILGSRYVLAPDLITTR